MSYPLRGWCNSFEKRSLKMLCMRHHIKPPHNNSERIKGTMLRRRILGLNCAAKAEERNTACRFHADVLGRDRLASFDHKPASMSSQKLGQIGNELYRYSPCLPTKRLFNSFAKLFFPTLATDLIVGGVAQRYALRHAEFSTICVLSQREITMSQITTVSGLQYEDKVVGEGALKPPPAKRFRTLRDGCKTQTAALVVNSIPAKTAAKH